MSSRENYYSKGAGNSLGCHSLRGNSDKGNIIKKTSCLLDIIQNANRIVILLGEYKLDAEWRSLGR